MSPEELQRAAAEAANAQAVIDARSAQNLAVALAAARAGHPVFWCLVEREAEGKWTKRPIMKWSTEATTDEDILIAKHQWQPTALPALPISNLFLVIDADRHAGGADGVQALLDLAQGMPGQERWVGATTAGGGVHLYFQNRRGIQNSQSVLAPGIDVKTAGGYIILPGSIRADGKIYAVTQGNPLCDPLELPPLPETFATKLLAAQDKGSSLGDDFVPGREATQRERRFYSSALARECTNIRNAGAGTWNNTLSRGAFTIFRMVAGGWGDRDEAVRAVLGAALDARPTKDGEARATMQSAWDRAKANPRGPLPIIDRQLTAAEDIAHETIRRGMAGENTFHPDFLPRHSAEWLQKEASL